MLKFRATTGIDKILSQFGRAAGVTYSSYLMT
jgi:hypothetical protein